jgi:hypothetical protein
VAPRAGAPQADEAPWKQACNLLALIDPSMKIAERTHYTRSSHAYVRTPLILICLRVAQRAMNYS